MMPASETLRWGEEPVEALSSRRGRICLNGIWQFVPRLDPSESRPPGGVAYIRVPGSWTPAFMVPGLVSRRGKGPSWRRFPAWPYPARWQAPFAGTGRRSIGCCWWDSRSGSEKRPV